MNLKDYALELEGKQTVESIMDKLGIGRAMAIKKLHELRKAGYAATSGGGRQKRIYTITAMPHAKSQGLFDMINHYSKVQIVPPFEHRVYDKKLTVEEAIVKAIGTGMFRVILASLALFNHVKDWAELNRLAKKHNVQRVVGALYDVAKATIRVKKMDCRTRKALLAKESNRVYVIDGLKSKDFKAIQDYWKVYIPFNKADLMRYKE